MSGPRSYWQAPSFLHETYSDALHVLRLVKRLGMQAWDMFCVVATQAWM